MIMMEMMEVGWVAFRSIERRVRLLGSCDDIWDVWMGYDLTCIGVGHVYFEHEWRDHRMRHCSGVEYELGVGILILQCF